MCVNAKIGTAGAAGLFYVPTARGDSNQQKRTEFFPLEIWDFLTSKIKMLRHPENYPRHSECTHLGVFTLFFPARLLPAKEAPPLKDMSLFFGSRYTTRKL